MKFSRLLSLGTALFMALPAMAQVATPETPEQPSRQATPSEGVERIERTPTPMTVEEEIEDVVIDLAAPPGTIDGDDIFIDAPGELSEVDIDSLRTALKIKVRKTTEERKEIERQVRQLSREIRAKARMMRRLRVSDADTAELARALEEARLWLDSARVPMAAMTHRGHALGSNGEGLTMTVINDSAKGVKTRNFMMIFDGDSTRCGKGVSLFSTRTSDGKGFHKIIVGHYGDTLNERMQQTLMFQSFDSDDSVPGMPLPPKALEMDRMMEMAPCNLGTIENRIEILNQANGEMPKAFVLQSFSDSSNGRRMHSVQFRAFGNCASGLAPFPLGIDSAAVVQIGKLGNGGNWIVVGHDSIRIKDDKDAQMVIRVDGSSANGRTRVIVITTSRTGTSPRTAASATSLNKEQHSDASATAGYLLEANRPNPFSESTTIGFTLPSSEHVRLEVFDATGAVVKTVVDEVLPAGAHNRTLDANDLPNGIYLYRLVAGRFSETKTMTVAK